MRHLDLESPHWFGGLSRAGWRVVAGVVAGSAGLVYVVLWATCSTTINDCYGGMPGVSVIHSVWAFLDNNDKPLLVLFTAALAIYTAGLFRATQRLAVDGLRSTQQQSRAYVALAFSTEAGPAGVVSRGPAQVGFGLVDSLVNSGDTPAREISCGAAFEFREHPLLPFQIPLDLKGDHVWGAFTLGAGARIATQFKEAMTWDEAQFREQLADNNLRLYMQGWIRYRDVFGSRHRTTFCYRVTLDDRGQVESREQTIFNNDMGTFDD